MPVIHDIYGDCEIELLGVKFSPKPKVDYMNDYVRLFKHLQGASEAEQIGRLQGYILGDLWFLCYFIITNAGTDNDEERSEPNEVTNDDKGFCVERAKEVGDLYETYTIDLWARFHFKSLLKTIGKTVQYHLLHPDHCTLILSYKKGAAESFQDSIAKVWENKYMKWLFPMRLYDNPQTEASSWGLEKGIAIKRENKARKEKTVESSGLIEGMKTGGHYERLIFDDISTADLVGNVDSMNTCFDKFQIALNLGYGTDKDIIDISGTYYHYQDPLVKIGEMAFPSGKKLFTKRTYAATDNGRRDGKPVLVSKEHLEKLKIRSDFSTQHLLDPTPQGEQELDGARLQIINHQFIPKSCACFMLVDPAGDATKDGCDWAVGKVMVEPNFGNLALSRWFIVELQMVAFSHAEAISVIRDIYLRGEYVHQIGIEDDRSMTHKFVTSELGEKGRIISEDMGNLVLLKHQGRNKDNRIASAWQWPLLNDKCYISNRIPAKTIEKLKTQLNNFPFGLKDGIDMLAYLPDMISEFLMWPAVYDDEDEDREKKPLYDYSTTGQGY